MDVLYNVASADDDCSDDDVDGIYRASVSLYVAASLTRVLSQNRLCSLKFKVGGVFNGRGVSGLGPLIKMRVFIPPRP